MALTLAQCSGLISHTRGRLLDPRLGGDNAIINQAGQLLTTLHRWKWLDRPPVSLDLRGSISISGATWTESTKTLTRTAGWTDYSYQRGDVFTVVSGTGATPGDYHVQSRPNANSIVLASSIGAGANGQTDIAGTMEFPWIVLPSDFGEKLAVSSGTLTNGFQPASYQLVLDQRAAVPDSSWAYFGVIAWRAAFTDLTPPETSPVPRIELDRSPTTNGTGAFNLIYKAGWPSQIDDASFNLLPVWMEPLFIQVLRAVARGYEEEDEGSMSARIAEIMAGPIFAAAMRRDAFAQTEYGRIQGGALGQASAGPLPSDGYGYLANPVPIPTSL